MTNKEAIEWLKDEYEHARCDECIEGEYVNALEMAIKALEQGDILDKIKAEIEETYINITYQENKDRQASWGLRRALEILDKYKAESEDVG